MTIEKFPLALKEDLRKVEREVKHEVANLTLQLEASQRVPQGKTYGTNFATTFAMEIDTARTSSDAALSVGASEITTRDASQFVEGTEVTIFDDVNLERIKISSISGNVITLERATTKAFKAGVNIARSMGVQSAVNKNLDFGVWGTFANANYNLSLTLSATTANRNNITFIKDTWYILHGSTLKKMNINGNTFVDVSIAMPAGEDLRIFKIRNFLVIASNKNINVYDDELNLLKSLALFTANVKTNIIPDTKNNRILIFSSTTANNYSDPLNVMAVTIPANGIAYISTATKTLIAAETYVSWNQRHITSPHIFHNDGKMSILLVRTVWELDSNSSSITVKSATQRCLVLDGNLNLLTNTPLAPTIGTIDIIGCGVGYEMDGTYRYYFATAGAGSQTNIRVATTTNGVDFTYNEINTSIYFDNSLDFLVGINANKTVFIRSYYSNAVLRFLAGQITPNVLELNAKANNRYFEALYVAEDSTDDNAYFLMKYTGAGTTHNFKGSGALGYGNELMTNDIRFKTQPTKEIAMWIQHDNGLSVSESYFGTLPMQKETVQGETQFTAISTTNEHNEIRFTITRPSVDDNIKVTKILGGIG